MSNATATMRPVRLLAFNPGNCKMPVTEKTKGRLVFMSGRRADVEKAVRRLAKRGVEIAAENIGTTESGMFEIITKATLAQVGAFGKVAWVLRKTGNQVFMGDPTDLPAAPRWD